MKNLKILMVALALLALPASAFGQDVSCEDCTHDVSVYMGEGGVVATVDGDAEMVTWVTTCSGVTRSGELTPDDDGMVAALFSMDNGLACMATGEDMGSFQIGPVKDGGWFWITDDMNSAVGALVADDIQKNDMVEITSAGDGVTMTAGTGAVYLKETATGRVGILPTIVAEPPADPAEICGPRRQSAWPYTYTQQMNKSCMLGAGRTKIRLVGPGAYGSRSTITNGMVYRPTAGNVTVTADVWHDGMGSYTTTASDGATYGVDLRKGWPGTTFTGGTDHNANWLAVTFTASLDSGDPQTGDLGGANIALTEDGSGSSPAGQATITITPNDDYCSKDNNHTATVNLFATPGTNAVHPPLAVGKAAHGLSATALAGVNSITQLRVVCPPAGSPSTGSELVPDNPFPTE